MNKLIFDILRCPLCAPEDKGHLSKEGDTVRCESCQSQYPLIQGVPNFLSPTVEDSSKRAFTVQWSYRAQGKFEKTNRTFCISNQKSIQYLAETLDLAIAPGDWLLDAGCGSGEKTILLAQQYPQAQVVALDFSDTLRELLQKTKHLENLHIIQGDVNAPPFRQKSFKAVFSIGVLHHTKNTKESFEAVSALVKPGGSLIAWLYPHWQESPLFQKGYYLFRDLLFLGRGHLLPDSLRLFLIYLLCLPLLFVAPLILASRKLNSSFYEGLSISDLYRGIVFLMYDNIAPPFQFRPHSAEVKRWFNSSGYKSFRQMELGLYFGQGKVGLQSNKS